MSADIKLKGAQGRYAPAPRKYKIGDVVGPWTITGFGHPSKWGGYICRCVCGTTRRLSTAHIQTRLGCSECDKIYRHMMIYSYQPPPKPIVLDPDRVRPSDIRKAVSEYFKVSLVELISPERSRRLAWPRMLAMALTRELTNLSNAAIGNRYGGRDHSTAIHAQRRIQHLRQNDEVLNEDYITLKARLTYRPANDAEAA